MIKLRHSGEEPRLDLDEGGILRRGWVDLEQRLRSTEPHVRSKDDKEVVRECLAAIPVLWRIMTMRWLRISRRTCARCWSNKELQCKTSRFISKTTLGDTRAIAPDDWALFLNVRLMETSRPRICRRLRRRDLELAETREVSTCWLKNRQNSTAGLR
jgi:hypothetical protein